VEATSNDAPATSNENVRDDREKENVRDDREKENVRDEPETGTSSENA
jgi:hypothetical protein